MQAMSDLASVRPWVTIALAVAVVGCSHKTPSDQISGGLAPFTACRNQTTGLVAHTKRTLAAADVNTLAVAYTALQEKANAYASFMVEAATTSSFDSTRNAKYASDLGAAIAAFNTSYDKLEATHGDYVAGAWVTPFAHSLQEHWNQYSGTIAGMSPQTKLDLVAQLKRDTVWPNYEDIATEPVKPTATPH